MYLMLIVFSFAVFLRIRYLLLIVCFWGVLLCFCCRFAHRLCWYALTLPCLALPSLALPCHPALPGPALPCLALPCPALPCPVLPLLCPALPCRALGLPSPWPAFLCSALRAANGRDDSEGEEEDHEANGKKQVALHLCCVPSQQLRLVSRTVVQYAILTFCVEPVV